MALNNAVDSTDGVSQIVIDSVKEWRDWLFNNEDDDDSCERFMFSTDECCCNRRRDAEYLLQCLRVEMMSNSSDCSTSPQKKKKKTTELALDGNLLSDEAIPVVCEFLQQPNSNMNHILALRLEGCPHQQQLLQSLQTNTSVKELKLEIERGIWGMEDDDEDDDENDDNRALWISNLMQHKRDWIALRFYYCRVEDILPDILRRRMPHLQTLELHECLIGDVGVRLILEALSGDSFPVLKDLDLQHNKITAVGLRCFAELGPVALRHVERLDLGWNVNLLDDLEITNLFVKNMLLSDEMMALKELHLRSTGTCSGEHFPIIIKACENDKNKLQVLEICDGSSDHMQLVCDQLIESLPKINKLEHLICDTDVFAGMYSMLSAAFEQNTSIVELTLFPNYQATADATSCRLLVVPILKRNQCLKYADSLMALQPKTQMPFRTKSGIWARAFAKMAPPPPPPPASSNDSTCSATTTTTINAAYNYPGASAIFKILQKLPAILEKQLRRPATAAAAAERHRVATIPQPIREQQQQQDPPQPADNDNDKKGDGPDEKVADGRQKKRQRLGRH